MILDRLVLKNFKRFRHEEIRFKDGITGILGNNGTGKSSLVQAIFFALYGVQATGISADYIVSAFASPKEKCEVRLDFRIGGDEYTVLRTFKKGKTVSHDATFHHGGKLVATGVSQVEEEVKRTLGMGPVDFKNTIYAGQKDLLTLLENTPGRRKEWFLRALGIDYLNAGSQKCLKEQIDTKAGELQRKEGELEAMAGRQDAEEFAALQASVAEFGKTMQSLAAQHAEASEKKRVLDEELREQDRKKTEHTQLRERLASGEREAQTLAGQKVQLSAKLDSLAQMEPEFRALEKQIAHVPEKKKQFELFRKQKAEADNLRTEERFALQKAAEFKATEDKARAKLLGLDRDAAKLQSLIAEIATTLALGPGISQAALEPAVAACGEKIQDASATLSAQQNQLETEHTKILADFKTIKTAGPEGTCPLCRQKLGTHFTEIEQEFRARIREIDEEAVEVFRGVEKVIGEKRRLMSVKPALVEVRTLEAKLKQRPEVEADLAGVREQIAAQLNAQQALTKKIAELAFDGAAFAAAEKEIGELEKTERKYNDIRPKLAEVTHVKEQSADLDTRIQEKTRELEKLRSEIADSPYDEKKGSALEQKRREIETALRSTDTESARTTERLRHTEEKIAEYKRTEAQIAALQKQAGELREEIELLKLTRTLIAEYVVYLMQVVRSRLEGEVSRIISEITGGRYEQVLLDEEFNLLVRDVDNDYAIDRFSGGEQDDIAVALRIALSRYLAELHQVHESTFLIFDEIFGSQDEERRNNLLTALRTQESRFPQILLISHIAEMQGEFANTLVIEMGTDQSSRVREVA
jgi:exonuclease SbcC